MAELGKPKKFSTDTNDPSEIEQLNKIHGTVHSNTYARDIDAVQMKNMVIDDLFNQIKLTIEKNRILGRLDIPLPKNMSFDMIGQLIGRLVEQKYNVTHNDANNSLYIIWF